MPNGKGFFDFQQPMSKSQPGSSGGHKATYGGDGYKFDEESKVTNNKGSDYHELGGNSGLYGNFQEKDANMERLMGENKKGQTVCNYSATHEFSSARTGGGASVYPVMPIPEVYKPATSQKEMDETLVNRKEGY